jgi:hypothetical protein
VRNAMGQRISFSGSGASYDEERWPNNASLRHAMFHSAALFWIEPL